MNLVRDADAFLCVIPGRRIEKHGLKTVSRGKEATEMFQHPSIKARIGVLVSALMLACSMAIAADEIECDLYDWLANKSKSKYKYYGEYMNQFSWAELVHSELDNLSYDMDME